ncbi:ATP-binding cassette domain-containing protein [Candidatus Dependentiae bacterium]|nr:ATP-binding cassette domain-containing protein [Candidatus Dependentiae bacterium]
MIFVKNLSLQFGSQTVFDNVSCNLSDKDKIGLVGRNGTGKSTLLKVIAGFQDYDKGDIETSSHFKIAYMPQEVVITSNKNVVDETMASIEYLHKLKEESDLLEQIIVNDPTEEQMTRYADIQHELLENNFDEKRAQAQRILMGLGFDVEKQQKAVSQLSVGWRMRIVLAKLLLQDADFYLFDEPTNHLDITAKNWFLDFLKEGNFGYLLVCHDRYFLDKACNKTYELSMGKLTIYHGNYSYYIAQKEIRQQHLERAYEQQQREIKQQERTIERFKASASKAASMQSMLKKLEKIERIEIETGPRVMNLRLQTPERSGHYVLTVKNVAHSFNQKLFDHVSFEIQREEKAALIAPNGTGKTTLFNLIAKKIPLQHGSISLGHNVTVALFDQDQEKVLDPNKTILDEVITSCPRIPESQIRATLGALLFSGDDIFKKTKVLSGGERNRVAMAKVILSNANFLLLDEPTNHLDIESKEVILNALRQYQGTILFVSHDQDFVNKLASKIIELTPKGIKTYDGNYEQYLEVQEQIANLKTDTTKKQPAVIKQEEKCIQDKDFYDLEKRSKSLEKKIEQLEKQTAFFLEKMGTTEYGSAEYQSAQEDFKKSQNQLEAIQKEWEDIQKSLDRKKQ